MRSLSRNPRIALLVSRASCGGANDVNVGTCVLGGCSSRNRNYYTPGVLSESRRHNIKLRLILTRDWGPDWGQAPFREKVPVPLFSQIPENESSTHSPGN